MLQSLTFWYKIKLKMNLKGLFWGRVYMNFQLFLGIILGIAATMLVNAVVDFIIFKKQEKTKKDLEKCQGCSHFFECAGKLMKKSKCEFFIDKKN